jgi:hypothetical protein
MLAKPGFIFRATIASETRGDNKMIRPPDSITRAPLPGSPSSDTPLARIKVSQPEEFPKRKRSTRDFNDHGELDFYKFTMNSKIESDDISWIIKITNDFDTFLELNGRMPGDKSGPDELRLYRFYKEMRKDNKKYELSIAYLSKKFDFFVLDRRLSNFIIQMTELENEYIFGSYDNFTMKIENLKNHYRVNMESRTEIAENTIGWVHSEDHWLVMRNKMFIFFMEMNRMPTYQDDPAMYEWVEHQRESYRNKSLNRRKTYFLEELPFWSW